ncbi:MAG: hypothetical protein KCCBMMGE_00671 [Candidatus Methanoperedenaceae archaeon GB37]|nr:MAG: hypothetical protein KCCBMMGE_00671 [Candidatus Methanoperedenaceae archaeon GB37]
MNIYESLLYTAKNYPDKLALVYKGQKETFPELLNKIQRLMTSFQTLGMKKRRKASYLPPQLPTIHLCLFSCPWPWGYSCAFRPFNKTT